MGNKKSGRIHAARQRNHSVMHRFCGLNPRGKVVSAGLLEYMRALGEPGQYLAGLMAGYTDAEIAAKREWTASEARKFKREAIAAAEKWRDRADEVR